MEGWKRLFIVCDCGHFDHSLCFSYIPGDEDAFIYVDVHMTKRPFFARIWNAIRYIFKGDMDLGHWHEVLLTQDDVGDIAELFLKEQHERFKAVRNKGEVA